MPCAWRRNASTSALAEYFGIEAVAHLLGVGLQILQIALDVHLALGAPDRRLPVLGVHGFGEALDILFQLLHELFDGLVAHAARLCGGRGRKGDHGNGGESSNDGFVHDLLPPRTVGMLAQTVVRGK
jgi:hypothetical protein